MCNSIYQVILQPFFVNLGKLLEFLSVALGRSKEWLIQAEQCVHLSNHMPPAHQPEGFRSSPSTVSPEASGASMTSTAGWLELLNLQPTRNVLMYSSISNLSICKHHSVTADRLRNSLSSSSVMHESIKLCICTPVSSCLDQRKTLIKGLRSHSILLWCLCHDAASALCKQSHEQ